MWGVLFWSQGSLYLADFDRVRSFRTVTDFKSHCVTFAEVVERRVHEFVRVEKEIFLLTIALDEPESLVGETGDCSLLHSVYERSG